MILQGWAVGAALALAGYAWHDALRARFAGAGRWALALLVPAAAGLAAWNAEVEYLAFAFGAALALGWDLRMPRPGDPPVRARRGIVAGVAYAALVVLLAFAWSEALLRWGFVVGAGLVAARIVLVDPLLAWAARRRRGADADADAGAPPAHLTESATVK